MHPASSNAYPYTTDAHTDLHTDADVITGNANSDTYAKSYRHSNPDLKSYADSNSDTQTYANPNPHVRADAYTCPYSHTIANIKGNANYTADS